MSFNQKKPAADAEYLCMKPVLAPFPIRSACKPGGLRCGTGQSAQQRCVNSVSPEPWEFIRMTIF
jgi:hypothetical protein